MEKPDWGKRYTCFKCGKSFYDMNKPEVRCPTCGANPAKAPARGGAKSKIQSLLPKEEVETDQPPSDDGDEVDTPAGGLDSEVEIPEADREE
jgi:hypothetical protein